MHVGQDGKKLLQSNTLPTQAAKLGNSLDTSGRPTTTLENLLIQMQPKQKASQAKMYPQLSNL
jgi:hypothetical protein